MPVELAHAALVFAFMLSLATCALPLVSRVAGHSFLPLAHASSCILFVLVSLAFAGLIYAYATSDFSVATVVLNSHSAKPLLYKITGSWGNHEGSMLLWAWVLALYGFALSCLRPANRLLQQRTLIVQSAMLAGFLGFILFTSNPFQRVFPPAAEGNDLNPLLQDVGLALHPPFLYLGYVGFSIVFAFAVAGLWQRRIDASWAQSVQPWVLLAWTSLTLGIALGSWWAYRELGWGGWWFWDPVENVALLPWLGGTALLHSNLVLLRRGYLAHWVVLLAILCFAMSLTGTFIVRSGLILSVHAFTSDPTRGYAILAYIALSVGAALLLYARTPIHSVPLPALFSREGSILVNNLLLLVLAFTIALAILAPLLFTVLGQPAVTVGAPYFNRIFFPLAAPAMLLAGITPLLPWGRIGLRRTARLLPILCLCAVAGMGAAFLLFDAQVIVLGMAGGACTAWLAGATLMQAYGQWRAIPPMAGESFLQRGRRYPIRPLGMLLAHLGLALLCGAITLSSLLKERYEAPIPTDGIVHFGPYRLQLIATDRHRAHTYETRQARFQISKNGTLLATLAPEIRLYTIRGVETSEVAIHSSPWRDLYLVIGPARTDDDASPRIGVRLYVTPGMTILWLGFGSMVLGGGISTFARIRHPRGGS